MLWRERTSCWRLGAYDFSYLIYELTFRQIVFKDVKIWGHLLLMSVGHGSKSEFGAFICMAKYNRNHDWFPVPISMVAQTERSFGGHVLSHFYFSCY